MAQDKISRIETILTDALDGQRLRVAALLEQTVRARIENGVRTGPRYSTRRQKLSIRRIDRSYRMPSRWYAGGYAEFRAKVAGDGYREKPNFNRTGFLLSKLRGRARQSRRRGEIRAYLAFERQARPFLTGEEQLTNARLADILARRAGAADASSERSPFMPNKKEALSIFRDATRAAVAETNQKKARL